MTEQHRGDTSPQWPGAAPQQPSSGDTPAWNAPPTAPPTSPAPGTAAAPASAGAPQYGAPQQPAIPTYRSWQPGIIPLRPLSFGDFLAVPFKAMRFARATVIGAPVLFSLISMALLAAMMWSMFSSSTLGVLDPTATGTFTGGTIVLGVIALVAALATDVLSTAFIAPGVARAVLGEKLSMGQAWPLVRRRLGSLIGLFFLMGALVVLAMLVAMSPFLLLLAGDSTLGGLGVAIGIALLLALIPVGLAVTVAQGVARAIIVLENVSMATALKRLPGLMRGRIWWSLLIVFVGALLIGIATSILQSIGQFGFMFLAFALPESELVAIIGIMLLFGVIYTLATAITYAYLGSVYTLIYIDVRMRHEGFDMDLARAAEARAAQRY
ncbi:hypothetical protein [Demequina flava]|uniref:hypothetical protein n=1 Tax=Demequina flava TaxID=1095025 RepID=UPI0007833AD4|nr:hypothetical protein [Demequina flava]